MFSVGAKLAASQSSSKLASQFPETESKLLLFPEVSSVSRFVCVSTRGTVRALAGNETAREPGPPFPSPSGATKHSSTVERSRPSAAHRQSAPASLTSSFSPTHSATRPACTTRAVAFSWVVPWRGSFPDEVPGIFPSGVTFELLSPESEIAASASRAKTPSSPSCATSARTSTSAKVSSSAASSSTRVRDATAVILRRTIAARRASRTAARRTESSTGSQAAETPCACDVTSSSCVFTSPCHSKSARRAAAAADKTQRCSSSTRPSVSISPRVATAVTAVSARIVAVAARATFCIDKRAVKLDVARSRGDRLVRSKCAHRVINGKKNAVLGADSSRVSPGVRPTPLSASNTTSAVACAISIREVMSSVS